MPWGIVWKVDLPTIKSVELQEHCFNVNEVLFIIIELAGFPNEYKLHTFKNNFSERKCSDKAY